VLRPTAQDPVNPVLQSSKAINLLSTLNPSQYFSSKPESLFSILRSPKESKLLVLGKMFQ